MKKTILLISFLGAVSLLFCLPSLGFSDEHEDFDEQEEHAEPEDFHEPPRLNEEDTIKWLEEKLPFIVADFPERRQHNPEEVKMEVFHWGEFAMHYERTKERNPKLAEDLLRAEKLEHHSWQIAERYNQAENKDVKSRLKKELRNNLEKRFEIKLAERRVELEDLERELREVKARIDKRKAYKDKIIERHMGNMIAESDEALEWW